MSPYTSLLDLFRRWCGGERTISPSRQRWALRVVDDVLYDEGLVVGLRVPKSVPPCFFYLVTHFSGRFSLRERLEDYGGVPILPHELKYRLIDMGWDEDARRVTAESDDELAYTAIQSWVLGGKTTSHWRGCLIMGDNDPHTGLTVGRVIRGCASTTLVAKWGLPGTDAPPWENKPHVFYLLGQVRRNPPVLWARDAVYTTLGRLAGEGKLPKSMVVETFGGSKSVLVRIKEVRPWAFKKEVR